jgi:hypothetical protein
MNESGEAVHVERVFMAGSEKGCSHVYSNEVRHHERFAEGIRPVFSSCEGRCSDDIGDRVLAAGESLERLLPPLPVLLLLDESCETGTGSTASDSCGTATRFTYIQ